MPPDSEELALSSQELQERVRQFREGGLSTTLVMQLLSDLSVLNSRLSNATQQRSVLAGKLDIVLENQNNMRLQMQRIEQMEDKLRDLEIAARLNTEFRLKFAGAGILSKMLWILLGGAVAVLIEYWLRK